MAKNKKADTFDFEGKSYAVLNPTAKMNEDAGMEYNRIFSKALLSGALLRERLDQFMREQGLWDDKKEKAYVNFLKKLSEKEKSLKSGGIKLSEARQIALEMRTIRGALQTLIAEKNTLDTNTAQGQAENARFNNLLVSCLVYNDTGQQVFEDVDEYSSDESGLSVAAAERFANMYFGLDKNYEKNLPENKFLVDYNFADEENRLINSEGNLVDFEGRLINEDGRYIDEEGNFIDVDGNRVTEEGEYVIEFKPFLDDDGNPVASSEDEEEASEEAESETEEKVESEVEPKAESKPKRRGRPKKKKEEEKQTEEVS